MERLTNTSLKYLNILFVLWQMLTYYADTFCYVAPKSVLEMNADLLNNDGLIFVQIKLPRIRNCKLVKKTSAEICEAYQQYLEYALLPDSDLSPYYAGETVYDIAPCLFADYVVTDPFDSNNILINFLYICDCRSYSYYRLHKPIPRI